MNEVPGAKSSLSNPISTPSFNLTFCSLLLIPTTYKRKIYRASSNYSLLTVNRQRIHVTRKTESNTLLFIYFGYYLHCFYGLSRVHTLKTFFTFDKHSNGMHSGLKVSMLNSRASTQGLSPAWGHCVVFLGNTLDSHTTPLHPGV